MPTLAVRRESWPLAGVFRISRGARTVAHTVLVEIRDGAVAGRGECVPYARYGETVESVVESIEGLRDDIERGLARDGLAGAMPPGAARNALDCALWDLEAKRSGQRAWAARRGPPPEAVVTAYTLSIDEPEAMREAAARHASRPLLKVKLDDDRVTERVAAVRSGAPAARIIVDANEAWSPETLAGALPELARLGVDLVEQPLPAGDDGALAEVERTVPIAADESCHTRAELPALGGRYDIVNIKLDKTGGLTEALALRDAAVAAGFGIMVGCMLGTSLAMAPALLVAQGARFVDLDGPLLLAGDREPGLEYHPDGRVEPPSSDLWG
ncbi:MAG: L-Ala-D/L-Glu epimerase [Immundisolibacterales bacterium]|nr:L-Ala-D/L-Glu epimerase [Immundisolibacterales bacterium]